MIELVMFDADGVLFESDASNVAYYNAIFEKLGEPVLDRAEEIAAVSYSAEQVFVMRARDDAAKVARMKEIARTLDPSPFLRLLKPPFELRPFMLRLKRDFKLALATNRSATVPALVEHLDLAGVFDAIASARDKVPPKPAPDILELCLSRAGVEPSSAIYAGDSAIDIEAARAARVHFIAVGKRIEHAAQVESLAELPAALARFQS
jgi:phosphoglycolate phosphatase